MVEIVDVPKVILSSRNGWGYLEHSCAYTICTCLAMHEVIRVERPEYSGRVGVSCPRCGRKLSIFLRGKND